MSQQQPVSFSSLDRDELLKKALDTQFELLVIGGGVTGSGIALDAASRGISTVLLEKSDFASGTSSKSTKLIHGGLRYLKQLEIGLVRESGLERAVVNKLAPHLCIPEKMLLPLTEEGTFGKHSTSLALWVYDFLAKVEDEDQRKMLSREDTIAKEPLLKTDGLKGSGYYADWVDTLRKKNNSLSGKRLHLTKGVHIVVPYDRLPLKQCVYFDIADGRMAFAIPRGRVTYIGTTDTTYTGHKDRIVATQADRKYLIDAANAVFDFKDLTPEDVISNWAGVRPLIHEDGKSPSELSRKDEIFEARDGLISIAGGKLTGYRKMSERIVDKVSALLNRKGSDYGKSKTINISLTPSLIDGNDGVEKYITELSSRVEQLGLDTYYGWYLVTNYGKQAEAILKGVTNYPDDKEIALAKAEVDFCIKHEMIHRLEDFFVRRTGRLYFDILTIAPVMSAVVTHIASQLGWSKKRIAQEHKRLDILIADATTYYEDEKVAVEA